MLELTAGDARCRLLPERGGRIAALHVAGLEFLVTPEVDEHNYGAFPMAPWTGRVRHGRFTFGGVDYQLPLNMPPHSIHGTVRDHEWTVESGTEVNGSVAILSQRRASSSPPMRCT
jgi:aldose 1-epimerase